MMGMKERASQIGAELDLSSAPGRGTKVSVRMPLTPRGPLPSHEGRLEARLMGAVTQTLGILCVDDHPLVRKGIAAILANETDMKLVAEAGSGTEAVNAFRQFHPDITLMDLRMPGRTASRPPSKSARSIRRPRSSR